MTSVMAERVGDLFRWDVPFLVACPQISPHEYPAVSRVGDRPGPYRVVDHKQVLRRTVSASEMLGLPKPFACLRGESTHSPVRAGEEHVVFVGQEDGRFVDSKCRFCLDLVGSPQLGAVRFVQSHNLRAVVEKDAVPAYCQGQRSCHHLLLPAKRAGFIVEYNQISYALIPRVLSCDTALLHAVMGIAQGETLIHLR